MSCVCVRVFLLLYFDSAWHLKAHFAIRESERMLSRARRNLIKLIHHGISCGNGCRSVNR